MGNFKLLLGLVFIALVLSLGFIFIHEANAIVACSKKNPMCLAQPTCFCEYGGRALNHIRITTCDFEETDTRECPNTNTKDDDDDITLDAIPQCTFFKPVAECDKNEEPLVVPPEIAFMDDYCYCPAAVSIMGCCVEDNAISISACTETTEDDCKGKFTPGGYCDEMTGACIELKPE